MFWCPIAALLVRPDLPRIICLPSKHLLKTRLDLVLGSPNTFDKVLGKQGHWILQTFLVYTVTFILILGLFNMVASICKPFFVHMHICSICTYYIIIIQYANIYHINTWASRHELLAEGLGVYAPSVAAAHPVSNSLLMDRLMEARVSDQWLNSCSWLIVGFKHEKLPSFLAILIRKMMS